MYANNEVGTIEPIAEIARIVKEHDPHIVVHTDAVQAAGALDLNVDALGVDLLSIAAHKIYGPKGVGALYVRGAHAVRRADRRRLAGAQPPRRHRERRRRRRPRDGAAVSRTTSATRATRTLTALRDRLLDELPRAHARTRSSPARSTARGACRTAPASPSSTSRARRCCSSSTCNGIAASSGSACTTGSLEPSHVLVAMGVPERYLRGSLRLTLGIDNTMEDVERLLEVLPPAVERIRALAPESSPQRR